MYIYIYIHNERERENHEIQKTIVHMNIDEHSNNIWNLQEDMK